MKSRPLILTSAFVIVVLVGYWLACTAVAPKDTGNRDSKSDPAPPRRRVIEDDPFPKFRNGERKPGRMRDLDALAAGAFEGQRVLTFRDSAAMADFLARAGDGIRLLGRLDVVVHLGFERRVWIGR